MIYSQLAAASAVFFGLAVAAGGAAEARTSALDLIATEKAEASSEEKEKTDGEEERQANHDEKALKTEERVSGYAANPYGALISSYANINGVPEALAHAVIRVESNFRADATGAAGEIGLMQLKLSTARMMGYTGSAEALYDPKTNIKYGMKYLGKAKQVGDGTTCGTILKYNAGHGAKGMNPITANYCNKVATLL